MTSYLLDTSVLSLLAPGRTGVPAALADWFRANADRLYISTITVAEIEQGIAKLRRTGSEPRAQALTTWLDAVIVTAPDRLLPFDVAAATVAGRIADAAIANGRHPGFPDIAIAAIAAAHQLVVLTTNGRHFDPLGVAYADPSKEAFATVR